MRILLLADREIYRDWARRILTYGKKTFFGYLDRETRNDSDLRSLLAELGHGGREELVLPTFNYQGLRRQTDLRGDRTKFCCRSASCPLLSFVYDGDDQGFDQQLADVGSIADRQPKLEETQECA